MVVKGYSSGSEHQEREEVVVVHDDVAVFVSAQVSSVQGDSLLHEPSGSGAVSAFVSAASVFSAYLWTIDRYYFSA